MVDISNGVHTPMRWTQPDALRRCHQLNASGQLAGSLKFEKTLGSLATGEFGNDRWTFKRNGFLTPRITVRRAGSDADLAVFTPNCTGTGVISFASGARFHLRRKNFWMTAWAFEDEQGTSIVTLHGPHGLLHQGGEVQVSEAGAGLAETPVLVILIWYALLLMNDDFAGLAAITAAG